jgi:hypothetical protein
LFKGEILIFIKRATAMRYRFKYRQNRYPPDPFGDYYFAMTVVVTVVVVTVALAIIIVIKYIYL